MNLSAMAVRDRSSVASMTKSVDYARRWREIKRFVWRLLPRLG